jgi:hypothetical protein
MVTAISANKGANIMRTLIQATIIRDQDGYAVHDYGNPAPDPSLTLMNQPPSGIYILGKSGTNEKVSISIARNLRLWERARRINSPDEAAAFMNRWGQISRWLTDDGRQAIQRTLLYYR